MPLKIIVVIKQDPFVSHRAAEGLRIALGLSTGTSTLSIILLNNARMLLTEDIDEAPDAEILEKHLPVIQDLEIPIFVPEGTFQFFSLDPGFSVRELSTSLLCTTMTTADRVLVF